MFAPYIKTWLKHKTEASGWPAYADTEEKQQQYIQEYYEGEGVLLENAEKNPGKKTVAKLMLNRCLFNQHRIKLNLNPTK